MLLFGLAMVLIMIWKPRGLDLARASRRSSCKERKTDPRPTSCKEGHG